MEVGEPDFSPPKIVEKSLSEVFEKGFMKIWASARNANFQRGTCKIYF